jgi:hypothetical protein
MFAMTWNCVLFWQNLVTEETFSDPVNWYFKMIPWDKILYITSTDTNILKVANGSI